MIQNKETDKVSVSNGKYIHIKGRTVEEHYRDHVQPGDLGNTKHLFFLDIGRSPAASRDSIQFHMVSYCSAIE